MLYDTVMWYETDEGISIELYNYIDNTGELNTRRYAIEDNLMRKIKKGTFDFEKSIKAWMHLVDYGAKWYEKELGSGQFKTPPYFPKKIRLKVARMFAEYFITEYNLGNR